MVVASCTPNFMQTISLHSYSIRKLGPATCIHVTHGTPCKTAAAGRTVVNTRGLAKIDQQHNRIAGYVRRITVTAVTDHVHHSTFCSSSLRNSEIPPEFPGIPGKSEKSCRSYVTCQNSKCNSFVMFSLIRTARVNRTITRSDYWKSCSAELVLPVQNNKNMRLQFHNCIKLSSGQPNSARGLDELRHPKAQGPRDLVDSY